MSKIKKIFILILFTLMIYTSTCFALTGSVTTEGVRVRKEPSKDAEIVTSLNTGAKVEIIEKQDEWYKVKYQNYEGYMFAEYIKLDDDEITGEEIEATENNNEEENKQDVEEQAPENEQESNVEKTPEYPKEVKLNSEVKVYIIPSIMASQIGSIEKEKTITVIQKLNDWSYIKFENFTGWVRNYNLDNTSEYANTEEPKQEENNSELDFTEGYINSDSVNVREAPNTNSNILTTLVLNTKVTIVGKSEEWYKVEYGDYKGYIASRLISKEKVENTTTSRSQTESRQNVHEEQTVEQTVQEKTAYVSVDVANIRKQATTSSGVLTTLKKKSEVKIIGEEADFYKIKTTSGEGYIAKRLVVDELSQIQETTITQNVNVVSSGTATGEQISEFALQYVGYPYVYGGTTPSGFDCSGFVYYVYNSCGYKLSRSCPVQASSGIAVSKENLKAGDIVFFNNLSSDGSISHVGIYIGNQKFVHASTSTTGVIISDLTSDFYTKGYHSARRIIY